MECIGAWDCEEIAIQATDVLASYDGNGDGVISLEDGMDA